MKRQFVYSVFPAVMAFLFICMAGVTLSAESLPGRKTIVDYYLLLPDEYFQCEAVSILRNRDKLALIKKQDLKAGYLLAALKDSGFPLEAALYTDDNMGIKLLVVNVRCPQGCMCRKLDFFFLSDGTLVKDDGDYIFPKIEDIEKAAGTAENYEFVLPGNGKSINVIDVKTGKLLYKIRWSGGTFNLD